MSVATPIPTLAAYELADWQLQIEQLGSLYRRLTMLNAADEEAS